MHPFTVRRLEIRLIFLSEAARVFHLKPPSGFFYYSCKLLEMHEYMYYHGVGGERYV
jgi:hypothetical protein